MDAINQMRVPIENLKWHEGGDIDFGSQSSTSSGPFTWTSHDPAPAVRGHHQPQPKVEIHLYHDFHRAQKAFFESAEGSKFLEKVLAKHIR
jgi:hypothetical protein